MNPIEYNNLSNEEKAALLDICKEDPVVFIETVCGVELLEYQKVVLRETFKNLKKPDRSELRTKYLGCPVIDISKEVTCRTCKHREEWHHLFRKNIQTEPCCSCRGFSNWEERTYDV